MFGAFNTFGRLGAIGKAIASAWSPLSLWPDGIDSPGMWISPRTLTSEWQDYTGTTPVATPGTVADSVNPVGLALDIRAGATVLTDPGNHMLQSTSAARPLASARVNLLTYTEDFSNAAWDKFRCTIGANATTAPDGTLTADALISNVGDVPPKIIQNQGKAIATGTTVTGSFFFKKAEYSWAYIDAYDNAFHFAYFDIDAGIVGSKSSDVTATIESAGNGFFRATITYVTTAGTVYLRNTSVASDYGFADPAGPVGTGNISHYIWGAQLELGTTATDYQAILGNGYPYPSTGFTIAQLYDGVDDGMATATFTAGDLINGMDCMIPVRRDSAAACVAGLYNGIADATKFFGMAESGSGSGCVGSGAGTPTVWVDGVQLSGGTAVTRGTLHTALTVGDWHILEFRGLDLSAWTAAGFGLYTSYVFPGPRGDILLYPSTASTTDKDAARQYLADYYGVTLP
jgi:hypothetical protein